MSASVSGDGGDRLRRRRRRQGGDPGAVVAGAGAVERMFRRVAALACLLAVGQPIARAADGPAELDAAWTWSAPAPVEWAVDVGEGARAGILVATSGGDLYLLDARAGSARWRAPVRAAPGVRPAGWWPAGSWKHAEHGPPTGDVCVFDRHAVYGLALHGDEGLRWREGRPPAPGESYPDDPEHLGGWLAAHATADGVLALRRVGTETEMLLLTVDDGRPLWQVPTPSMTEPRIHVAGDHAAVLWPQGRDSWLLVTTLGRERPRPYVRRMPRWPAWSAATQDGIVTVFEREATVWPWAAPPRTVRLEGAARAGRVALWHGAAGPVGSAASQPASRPASESRPVPGEAALLIAGHDAALVAYDLSTGGVAWRQAHEAEDGPLEGIDVLGASIVAVRAGAVVECCAASGRLVGRAAVAGAAARGVTVCQGRLQVVWVSGGRVRLTVALRAPGDGPATETAAATGGGAWELCGATEPRDVRWIPGGVVLIARDGLRAYSLPGP